MEGTFKSDVIDSFPETHKRIQNSSVSSGSNLVFFPFQILLHLARSIFEEQSNLECLVTKIMREARDLLKCERCAVYLLDIEGCSEEVRSVFYFRLFFPKKFQNA